MTHIAEVYRLAYLTGVDPLDLGIEITRQAISGRDIIHAQRPDAPYEDDQSVACRIVGALLDAGWMPPRIEHTERTD
jgi:hypothetical protein